MRMGLMYLLARPGSLFSGLISRLFCRLIGLAFGITGLPPLVCRFQFFSGISVFWRGDIIG